MIDVSNKRTLAYVIGVALGDGNLSNPNKRAVRLRITCDKKYPYIIEEVINSIKQIAPSNKVGIVKRKNCEAVDISCYSNDWEKILGWEAKNGSKIKQGVSVPNWIKKNKQYIAHCLRGLFQTDGSIYKDKKYTMVNFVSYIPNLAHDVFSMIKRLGFEPNMQITTENRNEKHTIRVCKNSNEFINEINLTK